MTALKKVYIILINYNGWEDTIECIESILANKYLNYQIVLCDNNSPNGSLGHIINWAKSKRLPFIQYPRAAAEAGGAHKREYEIFSQYPIPHVRYPLIFVQTAENLGFAGGNNVCLKYILKKEDFEYVWLLNNDTIIDADALNALVKYAGNLKDRKVGIIGSKLLLYDYPNTIQGIGGIYNPFFAIGRHIGYLEIDIGQYDHQTIKMDFVIGASMFVLKDFLYDVPLMGEDYFLYYEELDWHKRGEKFGWGNGYAYKSKVYHKEGRTIGSTIKSVNKSEIGDYYQLRNRIIITRNHFARFLPIVYLSFILVIANSVRRGQWSRIKLIWRAVMSATGEIMNKRDCLKKQVYY